MFRSFSDHLQGLFTPNKHIQNIGEFSNRYNFLVLKIVNDINFAVVILTSWTSCAHCFYYELYDSRNCKDQEILIYLIIHLR